MIRLIAPLFFVSCLAPQQNENSFLGAVNPFIDQKSDFKPANDYETLAPLYRCTPEEIQARVEFCVFFLETVLWKIELLESWVETVNARSPSKPILSKQTFDHAKQHIDLIKIMLGVGLDEINSIDPERLKNSISILRRFVSEIHMDNNARIICDKVIDEILSHQDHLQHLKGK
jgi:hypothetical protein